MNHGVTTQLATEPDTSAMPDASIKLHRRAAKVVGDVLWWSFLALIFGSITIGVATELLL